jgi:predicted ATPase
MRSDSSTVFHEKEDVVLDLLKISNFKGFAGAHEVPLAPITLIYGQNSSGKSALLHALALLGQSSGGVGDRRSLLAFTGDVPVDLSGFLSTVHRHDPESIMGLGVRTRTDKLHGKYGGESAYRKIHSVEFSLDTSWNIDQQIPHLRSLNFQTFGEAEIGFALRGPSLLKRGQSDYTKEVGTWWPCLSDLSMESASHLIELVRQGHLSAASGDKYERDLIGSYVYPEFQNLIGNDFDWNYAKTRLIELQSEEDQQWLRTTFDGLWPDVGDYKGKTEVEVQKESPVALMRLAIALVLEPTRANLEGVTYVGPVRAAPQRLQTIGNYFNGAVRADGGGMTDRLFAHPELQEEVNDGLRQMKVPYKVSVSRVSPDGDASIGEYLALRIRDLRSDVLLSLTDVGYGFGQMLPIMVAAFEASSGPLLVEQPELHLHPRLQGAMAEYLANTYAMSDLMDRQLIFETHSENMLLRIQRMIREGNFSSRDLCVLYVGTNENSGSWVKEMKMSESGELLEEWPDGFFEERLLDY